MRGASVEGLMASEGRRKLELAAGKEADQISPIRPTLKRKERENLQFGQLVPVQQLLEIFPRGFQTTRFILTRLYFYIQLF
jgi:hypothetical protein